MLYCLICFILGWLASRMMGNGFSVGGQVENESGLEGVAQGYCAMGLLALNESQICTDKYSIEGCKTCYNNNIDDDTLYYCKKGSGKEIINLDRNMQYACENSPTVTNNIKSLEPLKDSVQTYIDNGNIFSANDTVNTIKEKDPDYKPDNKLYELLCASSLDSDYQDCTDEIYSIDGCKTCLKTKDDDTSDYCVMGSGIDSNAQYACDNSPTLKNNIKIADNLMTTSVQTDIENDNIISAKDTVNTIMDKDPKYTPSDKVVNAFIDNANTLINDSLPLRIDVKSYNTDTTISTIRHNYRKAMDYIEIISEMVGPDNEKINDVKTNIENLTTTHYHKNNYQDEVIPCYNCDSNPKHCSCPDSTQYVCKGEYDSRKGYAWEPGTFFLDENFCDSDYTTYTI